MRSLFKNAVLVKCMVCIILSTSFVFSDQQPFNVVTAKSSASPAIVVTIKPIYGLVAALMNGVAAPTLLCEGPGSTHTLSLAPSDIIWLCG